MRGVILLILLCALFLSACSDNTSPTGPSPSTNEVVYAVVGASDAIGFGSSRPCAPFEIDCDGNGYAQRVERRFEADGATVEMANRGIPGYVLSQAFLNLGRDLGRDDILGTFVDQIVPFIPSNSTHVSVFAGGNDANLVGQAIRAGRAGGNITGYVDQQVNQFGSDLTEMVSRLRARAPNARIVAMNLPNLAVAPYVNGFSVTEKGILQRIVVGMTDRINALSAQGIIVVDLMCEPRIYSASNYSADGFHPSDAGYALMADLLYPALRNGTAASPSSNCAQRTAVPVF